MNFETNSTIECKFKGVDAFANGLLVGYQCLFETDTQTCSTFSPMALWLWQFGIEHVDLRVEHRWLEKKKETHLIRNEIFVY